MGTVSEKDFNFAPPPPRRDRKEFEPPPWEKDQFDQLARERSKAAEQVVSPPVVPAVVPEPEPTGDGSASTEPKQAPPEVKVTPKGEVDDRKVAAMLFELKAEDGPATAGMHKAALIAGAVLLVTGVVLVIWAIVMVVVALQHPEQGRTGVFVGLTVLLFGAGFVGAAAWFVFRTLRLQGVL